MPIGDDVLKWCKSWKNTRVSLVMLLLIDVTRSSWCKWRNDAIASIIIMIIITHIDCWAVQGSLSLLDQVFQLCLHSGQHFILSYVVKYIRQYIGIKGCMVPILHCLGWLNDLDRCFVRTCCILLGCWSPTTAGEEWNYRNIQWDTVLSVLEYQR